jgi:hypothetical protein
VTPFEWTRRRLHTAAASCLLILEAKIRDLQNSAMTLEEEFASPGWGMRTALAQS